MDTAPEVELQQELQRFATQFTDRITQATEALEESSHRAEVRHEALRKNLRYIAAALEIATGPTAAINLVDMIVFVRLSRAVLERHTFDHRARRLLDAIEPVLARRPLVIGHEVAGVPVEAAT